MKGQKLIITRTSISSMVKDMLLKDAPAISPSLDSDKKRKHSKRKKWQSPYGV